MKAVSIVLLLAIIGASLQQAAPAPSCSISTSSTHNNSLGLQWLHNQNVTILPTAVASNDTICGGEFNKNLGCCDIPKLREFIRNQNEQAVNQWRSYIGLLGRVRGKFLNPLRNLISRFNVADITKRLQMISNRAANSGKFREVEKYLPTSAAHITLLQEWVRDFETNLQLFRTCGKTCFESLRKARAGFYCGLCSGAAARYTLPQTQAEITLRVDLPTCRTLVNDCFNIWKFNFGLTSVLTYITVIKNANRGDNASTSFINKVSQTTAQIQRLQSAFTACNLTQPANGLSCTNSTLLAEDHLKNVCSLAFAVNQHNAATEGSTAIISDLSDQDVDTAATSAATPARLLQVVPALDTRFSITVDNTNTFNGTLNDSSLTPATSVESSNAGESSPNSSDLLVFKGVVGLLVALCGLAVL